MQIGTFIAAKKAFFLLICFSSILISCNSNDRHIAFETKALTDNTRPDFKLRDISGRDITLSSFRGKVVLLEFWATWCPPCKASVPELIHMQQKYADKGFSVIGVSLDTGSDTVAKVSEFSSSHKINYPILIGTEDVSRMFNVTSIPVSFLIDKDGKIISTFIGFTDDFTRRISEQIEKLL